MFVLLNWPNLPMTTLRCVFEHRLCQLIYPPHPLLHTHTPLCIIFHKHIHDDGYIKFNQRQFICGKFLTKCFDVMIDNVGCQLHTIQMVGNCCKTAALFLGPMKMYVPPVRVQYPCFVIATATATAYGSIIN